MNESDIPRHDAPTIGELYPALGPEEREAAAANLAQYVAVTLRIYERICADPEAYARFRRLTAREGTLRSGTLNPPAC